MRDEGARAVQTLAMDFWPLILLFAISITGLALTVSQEWLGGSFYDFIAILHAITVIAALLYLPFGKFFHIFQRPAQLGVKLYQQAGAEDERRDLRPLRRALRFTHACGRSQESSSADGLQLFDAGAVSNWQELCPACKRKSISLAQLRLKEEANG